MKSNRDSCIREILATGAFLAVLFASSISATQLIAHQSEDPSQNIEEIRGQAETQHEIVILLIRKKQFEQAVSEANKIFNMKWPQDQEPLLLKELLYISNQFLQQGQAAIGIRLLEENMKVFKKISSQVAILKEKGYLCKSMNRDDKALECFREAQNLEKKMQMAEDEE